MAAKQNTKQRCPECGNEVAVADGNFKRHTRLSMSLMGGGLKYVRCINSGRKVS